MRPIKLEIAGLQSFEKKQTIDFDRLTEQGLFGIFGKTGSGKSTILDAITLALYGNIVRIDGSKDDKLINLLNINSSKIEVLYRFSIESIVYEVYRKFSKKRSGDGLTQRCSMSKNGRVVADKTREITEKIDELVGLNMDDFTRSVVLPQGKFSEFLKLKGVEKRKMLERIFGLEEYGKRFTDRLKRKRDKKRQEVEALENQIMGKGEIEPQEIDIKKEELESLNIEKEKFDRDNREFQKGYREKEEIKKLCDELEEHKKIQIGLDKREGEIEGLRVRVYRAKEANDINILHRKRGDKKTV
jgi:exonuclease SbcC